jgi:hypothetical protein
MRVLRNIIIVLLLLVLAGISIVGLMIEMPAILSFQPNRLHGLGRSFISVMRPGLGLFWMWFGLAFACLLVLLMTILRPRKQMKIEVQMGGGRVVIMDSAIKRYIRSALAELQGITVRRIDLRDTRLGVSTDIYADVRARGNLPVLERQMIQRVRGALAEDLGITSIGDVHVYIRDFEVAERVPVHTATRRAHGREVREEESEPEPATAAAAPVSAEYTRPSASTGPFDQVPMPASKGITPSTSASSGSTGPAHANEPGKYFTPAPASPGPAQVTDLGPRDIYALSEAAATERSETAAASVTEASPVTDSGSRSEDSSGATRPRRRGLFGMFSSADADNAATSDASSKSEPEYNPLTATEGIEAPVKDAETGSGSAAESSQASPSQEQTPTA